MGIVLGCVADDYTGASDLANTLSRNGLRTVQTIGIPAESLALPDLDAVVIALKIRSVPAPEAVAAARQAAAWAKQRGATHILYKICSTFDSTDAGNIGPVTDALRADLGGGAVPTTPAFPETGRTVYCGHLFVNGVPLHESPLKDHPLNPMRDPDLRRVLARQSSRPVGLLDHATIAQGPDAARAKLAALTAEGYGAAIADAVTEQDLVTLGVVAAEAPLSVGASGLGLGLGRALAGPARSAAEGGIGPMGDTIGGTAAILAGSCSQATLAQIEAASRTLPVLALDQRLLVEAPESEVERALAWAAERLADGPVLIAASAAPEQVAAIQAAFGRDRAGHAIEQAMAALAAGLVARGVRRLVVAGGETSGAVVDRLAIPAFRLGDEIAPGVPLLRTVGGAGPDLLMALKSGNFGGPDFFTRALGMMR